MDIQHALGFGIGLGEVEVQVGPLNGQAGAHGDGLGQILAVTVGGGLGIPSAVGPGLDLLTHGGFGTIHHFVGTGNHGLTAILLAQFHQTLVADGQGADTGGAFAAHQVGLTVVGHDHVEHFVVPHTGLDDTAQGDIEALGDVVKGHKVGTGLCAAVIGHVNAHDGEEGQLAFAEDGADVNPVGQVGGAVIGGVGQEHVAGMNVVAEFFLDVLHTQLGAEQTVGDALGNGQSVALGIVDGVSKVVQGDDQNVGGGTLDGLTHLAADAPEVAPHCGDRNRIQRFVAHAQPSQ